MHRILTLSVALWSVLTIQAEATVIDPDTDLLYRFTGTIVEEEIATGPEADIDPIFAIGGSVRAEIAVNWDAADCYSPSPASGPITSFHAECIWFTGGRTEIEVEVSADNPDRLPALFRDGYMVLSEWYRANVIVESATGELLQVEGWHDNVFYYASVFLRPNRKPEGQVQQIANSFGNATSHWFTFEGAWENVRTTPRPVPEPIPLLLLIAGIAAIGVGSGRMKR